MRYPRPAALVRRPTLLLGSLTLGLALTLTACGNDEAPGNTSAQVSETDHNDADVAFATDMIQHHAQALSMVDLTVDPDGPLATPIVAEPYAASRRTGAFILVDPQAGSSLAAGMVRGEEAFSDQASIEPDPTLNWSI